MTSWTFKQMVRDTNLDEFFYIEIRNEDNGGIRPSTLHSAVDSLTQAPDDVVDEWLGKGDVGRRAAITLLHLLWVLGEDTELRDLLDR